jgi:hypothetical protein
MKRILLQRAVLIASFHKVQHTIIMVCNKLELMIQESNSTRERYGILSMTMIPACENTRKHRLIHHTRTIWECDYCIQHQHRRFVYAFILGTTDSTVLVTQSFFIQAGLQAFAVQKLPFARTRMLSKTFRRSRVRRRRNAMVFRLFRAPLAKIITLMSRYVHILLCSASVLAPAEPTLFEHNFLYNPPL